MRTGLNKINNGTGLVIRLLPLLAGILLFLSGCDRRPNHPGWDYFPDMFYSPAYRTWSDNPVLADSMTMQTPVEGTIPRHMIPFQYERTDQDRERAGRELANPVQTSGAAIERGKKVYSVYCMNCHGERGDGQGYLFTSGKYLVPPTSLVDRQARDWPDGNIYHVVSLGYGVMAEHASLILPEDRWKSIIYIREELQGKE